VIAAPQAPVAISAKARKKRLQQIDATSLFLARLIEDEMKP
jgi:hypothetical protein